MLRHPSRTVVSIVSTFVIGVGAAALSIPAAYATADGCAAGVESDFNGDGRSDAVVADPYATVGGVAEAGRVVVLYGDVDNLVGEGARGQVYQGLGNVGGVAESSDRFGSSIAVADIDCDDYSDLVVGTPYEDINGQSDSGYVQIIWGGPGGLASTKPSRNVTQSTFGLPITAGDQLGYAVDALEDVGQGGTPNPDAFAIAIGVPGFNVSGHNDAGLVAFLAALDGGNVPSYVTQDSPGIPGGAESGDRFGAAVSLNYLTGNVGFVDAAVGAPNEDVGTVADAGSVTIVQDIYDFPESGIAYDQNTAGVPGAAEAGDRFGASVDTVRVGSTTRLAVGAPLEDGGSAIDAGSVQLFSGNGATLTPGVSLSQNTAGVSGAAENGDRFGEQLAFAAPGLGDSTTRLAVGVPRGGGAAADSGAVQVFPVTDLDNETSYSQDTPGIPGAVDAGDRFGSALAVVAGNAERVLLVGVPSDVGNSNGMVDVIPFGDGTPRSWAPGVSGVPSSGSSQFGAALAGSGL